MNILVLAYAISPSKGSEYSVAWNYVKYISKYHNLTVLYGASGEHMGDCEEMERYARSNPIPHVRFVPVYPNRIANILNWPNKHNLFVYTFYYAYQVWHKLAYKKAKELVNQEPFDIIHYVGMIGYREPGYLWKLGLPYIWGPIGGTNNSPWALVKHLSFNNILKHVFRSTVNYIQIHTNRRVQKAIINTDLLLTATTENQKNIAIIFRKNSLYLPENSIDGDIIVNKNKFINPSVCKFIMVGYQDERKNSMLFLKSLKLIENKDKIHIDIVGGGPSINRLKTYAQEVGIEKIITWHGQVTRDKAISLFSEAHMHVITSISEGNPTVIWEAMSHGVPTLSLDHCGMHDTIDDESGIRIPIRSYNQCINDIAKIIDELINCPQRFKELSDGVVRRAKRYTWTEREKILLECFKLAIKKNKEKR